LMASAVAFLGLNPAALTWGHLDIGGLIRKPAIGWAFAGSIAFIAFSLFLFLNFLGVDGSKGRISCLMVSLVPQLGLLSVFKYFNFFADSLSDALTAIGIQSSSLHLDIVLPVGVSFYTFQSLSYTIDIYRRQLKPTDRFVDFALF